MKVKCPHCNHLFLPFQDDIFLDIDDTYDDQYTWVTIPVLKSANTELKYSPEYLAVPYHRDYDDDRGDTDDDSLGEEH